MTGRVVLVGAGPGDPGLITVRGAEALRSADVVVFDRLVPAELLAYAPADAERVYVGKEPGRSAMPQEEISAMLVRRARAGLHVVRLKGGDPFVFGRGGEEALACAAAGVPFEVVPGVSSAVAAPAFAGIPVTHRGVARSFAVVTGATAHGDDIDLARVATSTDTLVVLMAAGRLAATCRELIEAGRPPAQPAAIVQWAATPEQRSVVGTLASLPDLASAARIGPPATLVVGEVAALARELAWVQTSQPGVTDAVGDTTAVGGTTAVAGTTSGPGTAAVAGMPAGAGPGGAAAATRPVPSADPAP